MIFQGDCRAVLQTLPEASAQCCVTSPPYWGLRSYVADGDPLKPLEIGLESTPEAYVENMVSVLREVRRVLRPDGTLWLNLGDSYARGFGGGTPGEKSATNAGSFNGRESRPLPAGLKPKDLCMIPARVALALQADGWWLRSDIIWSKPNPMPESVTDRPTKAHEYVFLLTKSERYFYDADAIAESSSGLTGGRFGAGGREVGRLRQDAGRERPDDTGSRNARSVWTIPTKPFSEAHFAVFPVELARRCILAGSRPGDTVLDPFGGSGTTKLVAQEHGRKAIIIELNPAYVEIAERRTAQQTIFANGGAL